MGQVVASDSASEGQASWIYVAGFAAWFVTGRSQGQVKRVGSDKELIEDRRLEEYD